MPNVLPNADTAKLESFEGQLTAAINLSAEVFGLACTNRLDSDTLMGLFLGALDGAYRHGVKAGSEGARV